MNSRSWKTWEWGTKEPHCPQLFSSNTAEENTLCYSGQVQFCYLWCIPGDETFIIAAVLARPGWATAAGWSQADQQFHFLLPTTRQKTKKLVHTRFLGGFWWEGAGGGDIGIFNNMLWKKKFLHPSILFGTAPTLSKILHSTILCIQKPTQKHLCVTHKKIQTCAHQQCVFVCVHTHTQPRALIFL